MKARTVQLGDVCDFIRGVSFDPADATSTAEPGKLPVLRAGNIGEELNSEHDLVWVPERIVSEGQRLRQNDIAICMSSGSPEVVGKTARVPTNLRASVGSFCGIIRPREPEQASFLSFYFRSPAFARYRDQIARGANIQNLRFSSFEEIEIEIPGDHRRIAAQLDQADRLRRTRRYALELSDSLLPSAFLELFGNAKNQAGGWPHERLGALIRTEDKINYGVVQPGIESPNGTPIVRVADMDDLDSSLPNLKRVEPEVDKQHSASRLRGDEILIACVGATLGKITRARPAMKSFNIARAVARVPGDWSKIDPAFLAHHLLSFQVQNFWKKETRTVGQPTLNILQIEKTPVIMPPLALQRQFAELVTHHERLRAIQRESLRQAEHLFHSFLHNAFDEVS